MTIEELFDEWLNGIHKEDIKKQTYTRYQSIYKNYVGPYIGKQDAATFSKREAQLYINKIRVLKSRRTHENLSPVTVNMTVTVLKLIYEYAIDYEILDTNPMLRVKGAPVKRARSDIKCFTRAEQKTMEDFMLANTNIEYVPIYLDLYTGLRMGELGALKWSDFDLDEGVIHITKAVHNNLEEDGEWEMIEDTPKSTTSKRDVPIPGFIVDWLKPYKEKATTNDFLVRYDNGEPMDVRRLRSRYDQMLKKLDLPAHSFHTLRHTYATRCLEQGMDIKTLSEILGHANANITLMVYTHSLEEHKKKAVASLQRIGG